MPNHAIPIQSIQEEQTQSHSTRIKYFKLLESHFKKPVVSYYTSFNHPVMVDDTDAEMLEGVLQRIDVSKGFCLLINSPGGLGLAAERIINVCRSYSGTKAYDVIVPALAKSAATMICFGADVLHMSPTSELGPVDPQITTVEDGQVKRFSVCNIVDGYKDLFNRAVKAKGRMEPFIQQLGHYDEREIKEFEDAIQLAQDISVRSLQTGMMQGQTAEEIGKKIQVFLTPKAKKAHGRPIYPDEAVSCGLKVNLFQSASSTWKAVYALHSRTRNYVTVHAAKCVETSRDSFTMPIPKAR